MKIKVNTVIITEFVALQSKPAHCFPQPLTVSWFDMFGKAFFTGQVHKGSFIKDAVILF
jgi:hypothetical protein